MHLPFAMTPAGIVGPNPPVIYEKIPKQTTDSISVYSASVNLLLIGAYSFFTTDPDRGRFFPVDVWFCPTVNGNASSTPQIRIGYTTTGTTYSDWVSSFTFASSITIDQFVNIPLKADAGGTAPTGRYSAAPSTSVQIYVAVASGGPMDGTFHLRGFYL